MISIAPETNSVQFPLNQPTIDQVYHAQEAENIHIANETTNENESKGYTNHSNKYIYPEFDGKDGERYLFDIIAKILPWSLGRTWQAAVSYQAPGQECYVSVERMLERVGPKERKIYMDYDEMERRGCLEQRRVRQPFPGKDGTVVYHAVTVKDFRGLYAIAHDYHLWITSNEYLAPERANLPLFLEDDALLRRLIRFENYRRLLVSQRPEKKRQEPEEYYEGQVSKVKGKGTDVQEVQVFAQPPAQPPAPYRIVITIENITKDTDSNLSTPVREESVEPTTIRNTKTEEEKQPEKQEEIFEQKEPDSKPKAPPTTEREGAAAAKRAKDANGYTEQELKQDTQKRGAAAAGISAEHYHKLNGGLDQQEEQERKSRAAATEPAPPPRREIPAQLVQEVTQFAQQYDSAHLVKSDVTRAAKIYFTAAQTREYFQETLFWAFYDEAIKAAKKLRGCEHTNSKGRVNRVPYFFTCLENAFAFSLEELVYLRSDYPLSTEIEVWDMIDHLRETYQQQLQDGQSQLTYRQWLEHLLDQQEHCKHPKVRENVTTKDY
jgi:hypothetical protein